MKPLIAFLAALILVSPCASAATIRVPADQPTIQAGIDAAVNGDTVLVADGTYTGEGNRDIELNGKKITLRSANGPWNCIIDAQGTEQNPHFGFDIHDRETWNSIISGLTISGGYPYGISVDDASPVIRDCVVSGNEIGIALLNNYERPLIESSRIVHNSSTGVYATGQSRIVNSIIRFNGRGLACGGHALISNCLIADNSCDGNGGGIYCGGGSPDIRNCTIVDNVATEWGGGIYIDYDSDTFLENCIIAGNEAAVGDQYALEHNYDFYDPELFISYSDVVGSVYIDDYCDVITGPGVIHEDPLFTTGPLGSHYLSQVPAGQAVSSPCVDTGDPAGDLIYGTTRTDSVFDGGVVDMGYHYPHPAGGAMPDTMILSGPDDGAAVNSPVVVFTFTGVDEDYPEAELSYSWRFDNEPWSAWTFRSWAAISGVDGATHSIIFEVRARDPDGDIDPSPALREFHYWEDSHLDRFARLVAGPGPGPGNPPLARTSQGQWTAYTVMTYGVNLAAGDIDGDGVDEVITGPGPGSVFGPHVRCFQPDGALVPNAGFLAYGTNKYGVKVAAGDVDGDGFDEIITGAGPGEVFGPHVRGWNWDGGPRSTPIPGISFFAYGTLKWGVNVACGDIDGDGIDEIITGAGPGAVFGPHVRGWRYDGSGTTPMSDVSWLAFNTPRWGVNVACGDLDGDGIDEIITGVGPGPSFSTHVRAWNYDGSVISQMPGINFFAYSNYRYGAVVAAADVDGDGIDELLTMPGPGPSNKALLRAWDVENGEPYLDYYWSFNAFDPWMTHGGRVAGSRNGWE